jgi:hypothetical protein
MPVGNNSAILAAQLEKVHSPDLEEMFALDSIFWKYIKARPKDTVSTRPERIVYKPYTGGKSRVVNLDGGDMGRGGAPQYAFGNIAPVSFDWVMEWTKLAEISSDSREKAVVDYMAEILKDHTRIAAFNIDSLLSYGDGANTLGIVTSYDDTNFIIYVDNAARFYAGQDVDYYAGGLGTAVTETITILGVDNTAKALYLTANPGTNPVATGLLLENASAGTANSGLNGILAYQAARTTGTYTGVSVAAYPGAFSTPTVNAGNTTLTPQVARLLLAQLKLARGVNTKPGDSVKFHMGLDQQTAWENTGINVTQNIQSGNATARDMLATEQISTIGGIEIITNLKAIPGRIDLLDFKTWYRTEVQALDFYEVDGKRTFWPMGDSGGVAASMLSYLYWMGNVVCDNPRANAFISSLAIPAGY